MFAVLGMFAILSLKKRHLVVNSQSGMCPPDFFLLVSGPAGSANRNCQPDDSHLASPVPFGIECGLESALAILNRDEAAGGGAAKFIVDSRLSGD
jgi:hypothetical protein